MSLSDASLYSCYAMMRPDGGWKRWLFGPANPALRQVMLERASARNLILFQSVQRFVPPRDMAGLLNWRKVSAQYRSENALPHIAPFYFDIDCKGDLASALQLTYGLYECFTGEMEIDPQHISVFFSGSKGAHLWVDSSAFNIQPSPTLTMDMKPIALNLCKRLAAEYGVPQLSADDRVYSLPRMLRCENQLNPGSGLYKIPLTPDELAGCDVEYIKKLAASPRSIVKTNSDNIKVSEKACAWWEEQLQAISLPRKFRKLTARIAGVKIRPDGFTENELLSSDMPHCIRLLLQTSPVPGQRNRAELQLACWARASGRSEIDATHILSKWISRYRPELSTGQSERRASGIIRAAWSGRYGFSCAASLAALRATSQKPDCEACKLVRKYNPVMVSSVRVGRTEIVPPIYHSLEEIRKYLKSIALQTLQPETARLIQAPPGLGKTQAFIEALSQSATRCIYAVPTHALCEEVAERFHAQHVSAHYWRPGPTEEDDCPHMSEVKFYRDFGYIIRMGPCRRCRKKNECTYRDIFTCSANRTAQALVMTTWHLRRSDFWQLKATSDRPLVIIDEDACQALAAPVTLNFDQLARFVAAMQPLRDLCGDPFSKRYKSDIDAWLTRRLLKPTEGGLAGLALTDLLRRICLELMGMCSSSTNGNWHNGLKLPQTLNEYDLTLLNNDRLIEALLSLAYTVITDNVELPNIFAQLRSLALNKPIIHSSRNSVQWPQTTFIPKDRDLVILDATAEPLVVEGVVGRTVQTHPLPRVRQQAGIYQIMDHLFTRGATRRDEAGDDHFIRSFMRSVCSKHADEQLLVITFMEHEQAMQEYLEQIHRNVTVVHYGALRGLDAFAHHDVGVIIGRPMPNQASLGLLAVSAFGVSALNVDFKPPDLSWKILSQTLKSDKWLVRCQQYDDPRWQAVWKHVVVGELLQATGRLRPLSNPATIYILTCEPLPAIFDIEGCYAAELFPDMCLFGRRKDFADRVRQYAHAMRKLRKQGKSTSNASVCRYLGIKESNGLRYRELAIQLNGYV